MKVPALPYACVFGEHGFGRALAGGLELVERLQPTDLRQLKENKRVKIVASTALAYNTISININNGQRAAESVLAKDARVREALELSLDRQALMQVVFDGEFIATNQPHAVDSPWYINARPVPARDLLRARQLLADAAVTRPSFTLSVPNSPVESHVAQVIQSMVSEAGFDMKIEVLEANTLTANATKGNYEAALVIWSGRADPDGNISIWLACDGFLNWSKHCNRQLDTHLAAARRTTDPALRLAQYAAAAGDVPRRPGAHLSLQLQMALGCRREGRGLRTASRRHHPPAGREVQTLNAADGYGTKEPALGEIRIWSGETIGLGAPCR